MKIALVNNFYYLLGGSERVMFDDQEALAALGHDVRPFASYDKKNRPAVSSAFFPQIADFRTVRGAALAKTAIDIVYSSSVGRAFGAFLDDFHPDIVHCHNIYGHLTTAALDEAKRRHIPIVMTVHDRKLVCPAYLALRQGKPCQLCQDGAYWRCLRWKCHKQSYAASLVYAAESYFNRFAGKYDAVSRFLCPSRFMQKTLIDSGIAEDRTTYHPNALAPEGYIPCFGPGKYVLYVGRLSAEKGLLLLLAAFERTNIPLRIAGTGPLEGEMHKRIDGRGHPVKMEGFCAGERLTALYRNSAFTVLPSECYENASMSILESFAYGKPVLASDIGGNPELVSDGVTGRLFPSGSIEGLAEVAREMWEDRNELGSMGRQARALIERQFGQERRLSDLVSIYKNVTKRVSAGAS
jgi:glycosyltransferase involved in cell wall biosynthesis